MREEDESNISGGWTDMDLYGADLSSTTNNYKGDTDMKTTCLGFGFKSNELVVIRIPEIKQHDYPFIKALINTLTLLLEVLFRETPTVYTTEDKVTPYIRDLCVDKYCMILKMPEEYLVTEVYLNDHDKLSTVISMIRNLVHDVTGACLAEDIEEVLDFKYVFDKDSDPVWEVIFQLYRDNEMENLCSDLFSLAEDSNSIFEFKTRFGNIVEKNFSAAKTIISKR